MKSSYISMLDKILSKKKFCWLFIYLFKFPAKLEFQILSHNKYNMFHVLSHNRYVGKYIIFYQCIFSLFLISHFLIFSLSQLYRFKSNKPKNTHFALMLSLSIVVQTMSPNIPPHLTNNLRDLDFTDHSIGSRSLTHSPNQIKLSDGSSPILGGSNGCVWGGLFVWLKLIYSFSTHITNYF